MPWNTTFIQYIDGNTLNRPDHQQALSPQNAFIKHMHARAGREKCHKNSGVCHTGEDVRGLVSGSMLDILSVSKVKDKMLHPVPPTIKREAKCLVILFGV